MLRSPSLSTSSLGFGRETHQSSEEMKGILKVELRDGRLQMCLDELMSRIIYENERPVFTLRPFCALISMS
jgi:hypothetical protein